MFIRYGPNIVLPFNFLTIPLHLLKWCFPIFILEVSDPMGKFVIWVQGLKAYCLTVLVHTHTYIYIYKFFFFLYIFNMNQTHTMQLPTRLTYHFIAIWMYPKKNNRYIIKMKRKKNCTFQVSNHPMYPVNDGFLIQF